MSRLFEKLRRGWRESQSDMADRVEADAKSMQEESCTEKKGMTIISYYVICIILH